MHNNLTRGKRLPCLYGCDEAKDFHISIEYHLAKIISSSSKTHEPSRIIMKKR
jgi:hypothetical protein